MHVSMYISLSPSILSVYTISLSAVPSALVSQCKGTKSQARRSGGRVSQCKGTESQARIVRRHSANAEPPSFFEPTELDKNLPLPLLYMSLLKPDPRTEKHHQDHHRETTRRPPNGPAKRLVPHLLAADASLLKHGIQEDCQNLILN